MNPYELYPTPQEVDAWTDEIWAAAQAPYTVTEEPLPETYIGPLQALGVARFLRFETGGDFFYALFQPALGGFVLLLHILPIIGIVFVMFRNEMALWYVLPLCMAFVTGLCRFAAVYAGKRIGTMNSLQNLRRDY